jgi:hypothetical protein
MLKLAKIVFAASSMGSRDFAPDSCVTADPAYIRTADEKGWDTSFFQWSEAVSLRGELSQNHGEFSPPRPSPPRPRGGNGALKGFSAEGFSSASSKAF